MQLIAPPKKTARSRRRPGQPQARGVALIFVLTTVAILTAIGVDFSYNSRVNLELAAQSRDALRAKSLAMSGITSARMLLHFQRQVDQLSNAVGGILNAALALFPTPDPEFIIPIAIQANVDPRAALQAINATLQPTGPAGAAGATGTTGTTGASGHTGGINIPGIGNIGGNGNGPNIRMYCGLGGKFDSNMVIGFLNAFPSDPALKGQAIAPRTDLSSTAVPIEANFGDFTGTFDIKISDEDSRFNINRLGALDTSGGPLATATQIRQLVENKNYDFLFDLEDQNHEKVTRNDTIAALRDWVDIDEQQTGFDPTIINGSPFVPGGGDENGNYSRYRPRYKAKNASMDSLDEMRMVYGVNDNFMNAFGDSFTVYPDINAKVNVNFDGCGNAGNPADQLRSDILSVARNPFDPNLQNPALLKLIQTQIDLRRHYMTLIGINANDFLAILQTDGIAIRPELLASGSTSNFLDSKSTTFRVKSTGYSGRVKRTLTAIVRYDAGMGQILYWHEE
jgi:general secretion pathway protein K